MRKVTYSALAAAALLAGGVTTASAADLGGNCCADLEERIAELEATTARKGNRKVSLTISGHVAQQVMWWDDGSEDNVYITDTGSVSIGTHVKFSGQANIAPGWTAGYVLNIEFIQNDSLLQTQGTDDGLFGGANAQAVVGNGQFSSTAIESSFWFVKSESLGKLSVGIQSSAADNQAILPDGSGSLVQANYVLYDVNGFLLKSGGVVLAPALVYGDLASCYTLNGGGGVAGDCDGYPKTGVRYDTPVFAGFSASASWGEDDDWAVSARYAGELAGFKLALATAYNESKDENGPGGVLANGPGFDAAAWQIGGYVEHAATGLFVYGAYAEEFVNDSSTLVAGVGTKPEGDMWYVKAGIRQRWLPLGHTVLYGEYGKDEDKMSAFAYTVNGIDGSELERYGLGVVQEIDNAAMSVWLSWRHYEGEAHCSFAFGACSTGADPLALGNNDLDDFDLVKGGALINF